MPDPDGPEAERHREVIALTINGIAAGLRTPVEPSVRATPTSKAWTSRDRSVDVAISRSRVAVALLVVLGWAAAVHAEDASRPPAGTRTLTDTPFQLVLPKEHLLPWLRDHGLGSRLSRSIGQSDAVLLRGLFPSPPTDVGGFGVVDGRFSADRP